MKEKIELMNAITSTLLNSDGEDFVIDTEIKKVKGDKEVIICNAGQVILAGDLEKAESGSKAAKSRMRKYMKMLKLIAIEGITAAK